MTTPWQGNAQGSPIKSLSALLFPCTENPSRGWLLHTLKTKSRQFDNFVVTGGTVSYRYDNFFTVITKLLNWRSLVVSAEELVSCQLCHRWWYRRLSICQPTVPPVTTKSSSRQLVVFSFLAYLIDVNYFFYVWHCAGHYLVLVLRFYHF